VALIICQISTVFSRRRKDVPLHGKVAALTETGFESIPVAEWWTSAFQAVCDSLPIAYAQTWRNAHDKSGHFYAPYPGHASSEEFIKFYNSPKSLFAKDLKNIYK
jgi:mannan endo-1,4-beta-mannosidase